MKATLICLGISIALMMVYYVREIILGITYGDEVNHFVSGFLS